MNAEKIMRGLGHGLMWSYAAVNAIYIFRVDIFGPFGPQIAGEYSIYASKNFFIVYHLWGAILALLTSITLWRGNRKLFMVSLFLYLIVLFYPYFTSSPVDRKKAFPDEFKKEAPPTNRDGTQTEKMPAPPKNHDGKSALKDSSEKESLKSEMNKSGK